MRKILTSLVLLSLVFVVLIQFVPYGRDHQNPPVIMEPNWDSTRTRELARRACFDCHSNQVVYPWYSSIAPVSWLVQSDIDGGREYLNFSEWSRPQRSNEILEILQEGEMPPAIYLLTHPNARLTDAELQQLATGLQVTMGSR